MLALRYTHLDATSDTKVPCSRLVGSEDLQICGVRPVGGVHEMSLPAQDSLPVAFTKHPSLTRIEINNL
jgi:hypothetical protein